MKINSIIYTIVLTVLLGGFTACEDMLGVSSSSVQYEDKHELNSAADSLYSVVGILSKLQTIADRTVLFGEMRGDLVTASEYTETDLRELINHEVSPENVYNDYSDYYAVINNCNYFLAKVDTNVIVSDEKVMIKEYAAVKAIRAWVYMQLALIYESVPFITEPILSLQDAEYWDKNAQYKNLSEMCDYFIPELEPYVDIALPDYGEIDGYASEHLFFPIRLLLGDMYLWKQEYKKAYNCYAEYMYRENLKTYAHGVAPYGFEPSINDISGLIWGLSGEEYITSIRMSSSKLHGATTLLEDIINPTDANRGRREVAPSRLWKELSEKQTCVYQQNMGDQVRYLACGDLRAIATYVTEWSDGTFDPSVGGGSNAWYVVDIDNPYKINSKYGESSILTEENSINIYRVGNVALRMAEALNRMGKPAEALSVLKYGIDRVRMSLDGDFALEAPEDIYGSVVGIHSRGSGNAAVNEMYGVDFADYNFNSPTDSMNVVKEIYTAGRNEYERSYVSYYYGYAGLPDEMKSFVGDVYKDSLVLADVEYVYITRGKDLYIDSVKYTYLPMVYCVDKVEQMIVDEMALETAFEGHRYYDLMRVAMRREDSAFLAEKIAHRDGEENPRNETLYQKLLDPQNWFIKKQ